MNPRPPAEVFSPGEQLKDFLEGKGWSQTDLAEILGRPVRLVNEIIAGKRAITPETAQGLGAAFDMSPVFWMRMEAEYQVSRERSHNSEPVARRARIYAKVPLKEMIPRGWIEHTPDLDALERAFSTF